MSVDFLAQKFVMTPGSPLRQVEREDPYIMLGGPDGERLYLQHGAVHAENGPPLEEDEWPDWLIPTILLCTRAALQSVEWPGPFPEPPPVRGRRR